MNGVVTGAVAGLIATVPMTIFMKALHKQLPAHEQYPLPPRLIVEEATEKVGLDDNLGEEEKLPLTMLSHFGYGAASGVLYDNALRSLDVEPTAANGVAYGLGVWALSYLGMLPATDLLSSATEHPARRNALMIAAHVVWGATLGETAKVMKGSGHTGTH